MNKRRNLAPDTALADELIASHYEQLKSIARAKRRRAQSGHTLQTTDLLHEGWLKLRKQSQWKDEAHFMRTAALAMRQVIVDYARAKQAEKRGGGVADLNFEDVADILPEYGETPEQITIIGDLMSKLAAQDPRLAEIVDLRYFAGFTADETAQILGITDRTVRRQWTIARAWLAAELQEAS